MAQSRLIFCDTEFRTPLSLANLLLLCLWIDPIGLDRKLTIDFRQPDAADRVREVIAEFPDAVWVGYSIRAEVQFLLAAGIDVRALRWLDLMCESRQITLSHEQFKSPNAGLLAQLEALGVASHGTVAWKESMRHKILTQAVYSPAEWEQIVRYGWSDVLPLPDMLGAICRIHTDKHHPWNLRTACFRADFVRAQAELEFTSKGFPVDAAQVARVFHHRAAIKRAIAARCNAIYGSPIFRHKAKDDSYHFSFAGLDAHLRTLDHDVAWPRTPAGRLKTADEFLERFVEVNPQFAPLHDTLRQLRSLNSVDLRELMRDGFIQGESTPYYTLTGRSQPRVKEGFILNASPFLRFLVRPPEGYVILVADWAQEEIRLAAALSNDHQLAAALREGDIYINLARLSGNVPPDATKKTHPVQRQLFKSLTLGVSYGMGVARLASKIHQDLINSGHASTLDEATERAVALLRWHRSTFTAFWQFVDRTIFTAKARGWIRTMDDFVVFVSADTKPTQIQNWPVQSLGGVLLREATKNLADERDPPVTWICSLHDAIFLLVPEDELELHRNALIRCMNRATDTVMRHTPLPLPIPVEIKTFTHSDGYRDERGAAMWAFVQQTLAEQETDAPANGAAESSLPLFNELPLFAAASAQLH
jgi:hypothetical protein